MRVQLFIFLVSLSIVLLGQSISALKDQGGQPSGFLVDGVPEDLMDSWDSADPDWWKTHFRVRVKGNAIAMLGTYSVDDYSVSFHPKYPLETGLSYQVQFFDKLEEFYFEVQNSTVEPELLAVFPLRNLPANALRIYLYFSAPMGFANPFDYLFLESGEKMEDVFVEFKEGLWNEDRTRLTLVFHPGRIKKGVGPNVVRGSILLEGERFTLSVRNTWKGARGVELSQDSTFSWNVDTVVKTKINPKSWTISKLTHQVCFETGRILDKEMLDRKLAIFEGDTPLDGEWMVNGQQIIFSSNDFNSDRSYELINSPTLEDISGNNLMNAFDVEGNRKESSNEPFRLKF